MDMSAMHNAAKYGDLKTVRYCIEEGVSVDSRDDNGQTPLHVAARCGQYKVAQLLIGSKCDINAVDNSGSTPVLIAAVADEEDVFGLLLHHKALVSIADHNNFSVLHYASYNGWADTVQYILSVEVVEEVDVDAVTRRGHTPLMLNIFSDLGIDDCAEVLLGAGADPNRRDPNKRTALHWAVIYVRTSLVRLLLGVVGVDLNPQDIEGRTPLHLACKKKRCKEIRKEMLKAGADYTIIDNIGETALSEGIREMTLTLEDIRLFVQHGLFFQEKEYARLFQNSILKDSVLKDASLCTQSVVNKFHRQTLPALKSNSYLAEQLSNIDNFKLNAQEIDEVEELIRCEIGRNNFCNVLKVHPMSLKALCILTLVTK